MDPGGSPSSAVATLAVVAVISVVAASSSGLLSSIGLIKRTIQIDRRKVPDIRYDNRPIIGFI